jgi:hypothetical protein
LPVIGVRADPNLEAIPDRLLPSFPQKRAADAN